MLQQCSFNHVLSSASRLGFSRFQWRRGACPRRRSQRRDDEPRGCQHDTGCIRRWNGRASLAHHSETQLALVHDAGVQRCDCGYGFHLCRSQHRLSIGGVDDWPHRRFCVRFNTLHLLALSSSSNAWTNYGSVLTRLVRL